MKLIQEKKLQPYFDSIQLTMLKMRNLKIRNDGLKAAQWHSLEEFMLLVDSLCHDISAIRKVIGVEEVDISRILTTTPSNQDAIKKLLKHD